MEAVWAPFFCSASEHAFTLHSSPFLRPPPWVYRHSEGWRVYSDSSPTLHHSSPIPKTNRRKLQRKTARHPWGGCVISLDNSWVHNSWPPHAHHLLCDRRYWLSQQHILSLSTTRRGWIINLWHILRWTSQGEEWWRVGDECPRTLHPLECR